MRRFLSSALAIFVLVGAATAQDKPNKEPVSFKTFDGVLIKGSFYPSAKGGNAPVVMFLHRWGLDRSKGDWEGLAKRLQDAGYAVLSFDFRGHGESKTIDPEKFWSYPPNVEFYRKKPDLKKRTIDIKEFRDTYLPYLIADIVAARQDIDNRNDNGGCNSSNIVLIGAEEGAAVGMLWIATEYFRESIYPVNLGRPPNAPPLPLVIQEGLRFDRAAGEDIAGAIWLSYTRTPNKISFPYSSIAKLVPKMREQIPMWFAHGAEDTQGAADAKYMFETFLRADKLKEKQDFTSKYAIPKTKLRGATMLGKQELNVEETIEKFLKRMVERRPNEAKKNRNANSAAPFYIPLQLLGFDANRFP